MKKKDILRFRQCNKYLYLNSFNPELKTNNSHERLFFKNAKEVELIARGLFPQGHQVPSRDSNSFSACVEFTKILISKGAKVIYGACFESESGKQCRIDILEIRSDGWRVYDATSSTRRKDEHVIGMAFDKNVLQENYPLVKKRFYLLHLNNEYYREGELDLELLFKKEEVTIKLNHVCELVEKLIRQYEVMLKNNVIPKVNIGYQCNDPFPCPFKSYCFKDMPEDSVLDLSRTWEATKYTLLSQGIIKMSDIPRNVRLGEKAWMQVDCTLQDRQVIQPRAIEKYCTKVDGKIYFLESQSFLTPVPLYDLTKVYCQLQFGFSVISLDLNRNSHKISQFIANGKNDPRIDFITKLIEVFGDNGLIFVYDKKQEDLRLREISDTFPEYHHQINNIRSRLIDLHEPFYDRYLYHPAQKGSSSLKAVAAAWLPTLDLPKNEHSMLKEFTIGELYERYAFGNLSVKDKLKIKDALFYKSSSNAYQMMKLLQMLLEISNNTNSNKAA